LNGGGVILLSRCGTKTKSGVNRLLNSVRKVTGLGSKDLEESFFWFGFAGGAVIGNFDIGVR